MAQQPWPTPPLAVPGTLRRGEGALGGLMLLNDEPVSGADDDELGARWAAEQLSALLLASRHATPFTLAVDGGWGMGKSSLMRLVDGRLKHTDGVHTVWYNAWSATGADALEGLIKSVLAQLDPNILRRTLRRLRSGSGPARLLRALTLLLAAPLGVAGMVDGLWRALSADATARNQMREALRVMLADWTAVPRRGGPGRLLVVFIDDLDRCSQETVLALCEALKVYLDVPGLAFVIGCDAEAMNEDGMLRNLTPAGAAFMEKIFQTTYRIPAPGNRDIQHYVQRCARRAGIADLLDQDQRLVELIAYRVARNPRRVKRLVNGLLLEANLNPIWSGLGTEAVLRTLLIQQLYIDFYRLMTVQNEPGSQPEVVETFFSYCEVRTLLRAGAGWTTGSERLLADFLGPHSVALPAENDQAERETSLRLLERELPESFPVLAADPAFVSLLRGLRMLEGSDLVFQRLREGVDRPSPSEQAPYGQAAYGQAPYGQVAQQRPEGPQPPFTQQQQPYGQGQFGPPEAASARPGGVPAQAAGEERSGGAAPPSGGEQTPDWGALTAGAAGPTGSPYGAQRSDPGGAPQQGAARPAGPADPVSPALDQQGAGGYPAAYPQSGYGGRAASPPRSQPEARGGPPPVVVLVGFTGEAAGSVGFALQRSGLGREFAFNQVLWDDWLARRPAAVLCHVAAFGLRGHGFELIEAARRDQDYQGAVVFYSPTLTPNERLRAEHLGARITSDPDQAAQLLLTALSAPPPAPSTGSG
ncbi:P-loop NTPase fold protein [Actinacidiphila sp. bgisy144]|uniref:KAP family P-loop NTPase fold protein n=1 Tax=Actinacidiphila sp. bgisy144 TaxID=3413791 RepID=UPI003EBDEA3B